MANISLRFVTNSGTITGSTTLSDENITRILNAEKNYLGVSTNQETVNLLLKRYVTEMIGDTKTVERNAATIMDIPIT